ncbi:MAG: hypothetical protein J6C27_04975 [Clostridia bacterium]|nr:hypothetical protein [Clostridia bacterium]
MKKSIVLAVIICIMAIVFAGCGGQSTNTGSSDGKNNEPTLSFTVNGTKVELGVDATDILKSLGEPKSVTEEASCAFEGLDKTYFYGNFYLTTYPNGDKENIYSCWFVDDSLSTDENIYIGATKAEVESAYGAESFNGNNAYVIKKGASMLTIIIEDDCVSAITYDAIID